jgi:cytochrome c oxidase assembly factor 6
MGFTSSSTQEPSPPNREKRRKCWETRDAYFACLDLAGVVKAGEEGNACTEYKKQYETNCAKSWVYLQLSPYFFSGFDAIVCYQIEYFNQRRVIGEAQKDRLARGQSSEK